MVLSVQCFRASRLTYYFSYRSRLSRICQGRHTSRDVTVCIVDTGTQTFSILYEALFAHFLIMGHHSTPLSVSVQHSLVDEFGYLLGGCPMVVVSTTAFYARVRGSFPGLSGLKKTKMFLPHSLVKLSIVGSLCDREVACSASDLQGLNFKSSVWRAVLSHSSRSVKLVTYSLFPFPY